MKLQEILKEKVLVLDGAMGTMIQRYKLEEEDFRKGYFESHDMPLKGNNDVLVLTRPEIIKEIHAAYFEAGADIVETNTFSSTRIAQEDYGLQDRVYEINVAAAKIAKQVAEEFTRNNPEKPRFVAGSIGPTNKSASISPDVNNPGFRSISFEELKVAYQEQAMGLIEGGADLLLVETVFDTLNAKAALFGIEEAFKEKGKEIPVMVSGTITDASGRTLSGQTAEAFKVSLSHFPLLSIGFNCALGAKQLYPHLEVLGNAQDIRVSAHPNAGLPNEFGEYDQTPEQMALEIKSYLDEGLVNIIGGCCGTTPEHITEISKLAVKYKPRVKNG